MSLHVNDIWEKTSFKRRLELETIEFKDNQITSNAPPFNTNETGNIVHS